jgi:diguanylate cyclase (GGDEF)-like protein
MIHFRDTLKNISIFSDLDSGELDILVSRMKDLSLKAGDLVFREGDEGRELYVIIEGRIHTSMLLAGGKELHIADTGAGDFFGDMAIIEHAPRSATCRADSPCRLLSLSREDFYWLIEEQPQTAMKIMYRMLNIISGRLDKTGSVLSEMVRWGEDARKRAITDEFTGLFNRRYFDESFASSLARARAGGTALAFVMIDMDHFGGLNKTYGEAFGDKVILAASKIYRESFRKSDILARYGGDEFSFLLPGTDAESAAKLCGAMAQKLRALRFPEAPDIAVTLSVGVASFPEHGGTEEALKDAADRAVYAAKEAGRDRVRIAGEEQKLRERSSLVKTEIRTIAKKNRISSNIINSIFERDNYLLLGHRDPDADCLASMVAFGLLLAKFQKKVTIFLTDPVIEQFDYLLAICRYNDITIVEDRESPLKEQFSTVVILDTPKPEMLMLNEEISRLLACGEVRKIELDHHIGSDSIYTGDEGFRLVSQASSTCELIGYLCLKMAGRWKGEGEFFTRNISLAILTGIVGDSQMGKYLKSNRERWYYHLFSEIFHDLLVQKTRQGSRNLSSMEDVYRVIQNLSEEERACFEEMRKYTAESSSIRVISLDPGVSEKLFGLYGHEVIVNVAKSTADRLAEECGKLGMVAYYDAAELSDFIQFRLRRSARFTSLDLRDVLEEFNITNGGGHSGAIGFRLKKGEVENLREYIGDFISRIEALISR